MTKCIKTVTASNTIDKPLTGEGMQDFAEVMAEYSVEKDKGLVGGYNDTFPLTSATINNIYLEPKTGKYYKCIKAYNGENLTLPNTNFEELSIIKNSDKLENLIRNSIKLDMSLTGISSGEFIIKLNKLLEKYNNIFIAIRERGNLIIDMAQIKGNNNSVIFLYYYNGTHNITFSNTHIGTIKFDNSKFGSYIELSYCKEFIFNNKWYVKSASKLIEV